MGKNYRNIDFTDGRSNPEVHGVVKLSYENIAGGGANAEFISIVVPRSIYI